MSLPPGAHHPGAPPAPRPRHPQATTILVLGVVGVTLLPLVTSIPAWIMGARARREVRADPSLDGEPEIVVGWILGIVGTVFVLVVLVLVVLVLLLLGGLVFGVEQAIQDLPPTTPGVLAAPVGGR